MAYSPLPAKIATEAITLTNYDAIKGNFEAGAPDLFIAKGDIVVATGADAGARLAVGANNSALVPDSTQTTGLAWQIQPAARVYHNAAQTPTPSTWHTLAFNTERYDTDAAHDTVTNNSRLTVPAGGAGIYVLGASVEFDSSSGGNASYQIRLLLNGATTIGKVTLDRSQAIDHTLQISVEYALTVAQYVEVQVYTTEAVNVNAAGNYSPEFWFRWVRR